MEYLVDSHCHLHDRQFFSEEEAEEILKEAKERNVRRIICIGTDPEDSMAACQFAAKHPGVYWTYGIHPEEWTTVAKNGLIDGIRSVAARDVAAAARGDGPAERGPREAILATPPVAIGEVGLDYHSEGYDREAQIRLFEEMLQLALDNDLPLSFHVRNAFPDFFAVVGNFPGVQGVVHSFTDSKKVLRRILEETDFYVGVNGLATYSTLPTPPLERILLETDAPFLTPAPFRGTINKSGYIFEIAEWLAGKLGVEFEEVQNETTKNAETLFRFSGSLIE